MATMATITVDMSTPETVPFGVNSQLTGLKRQNPVIVRRGLPANVLRPWLPEATNGARRENPSIVLWGVAK